MSRVRVAILDDYQGVSTELADWSRLHDQVDVQVYRDTLSDEDSLIKRLEPYTIICAMRERTKFPASLLDKLPNLRLITTTGLQNRGIDIAVRMSLRYSSALPLMVDFQGREIERHRCVWNHRSRQFNPRAYMGYSLGCCSLYRSRRQKSQAGQYAVATCHPSGTAWENTWFGGIGQLGQRHSQSKQHESWQASSTQRNVRSQRPSICTLSHGRPI